MLKSLLSGLLIFLVAAFGAAAGALWFDPALSLLPSPPVAAPPELRVQEQPNADSFDEGVVLAYYLESEDDVADHEAASQAPKAVSTAAPNGDQAAEPAVAAVGRSSSPPVEPAVRADVIRLAAVSKLAAMTSPPRTAPVSQPKPPVSQPMPPTMPPTTKIPVTQPPVSQPTKKPPVSQPPVTQPPKTNPPVTRSNSLLTCRLNASIFSSLAAE